MLTPWAGSLADRLDRRKLLLVSQSLAVMLAAGLAALAWGGLASTWVVIGDALCLGVVSAFSAPAQQALIVSLVRRNEVPTAVALNSMTFNLARALGPAGAALSVHYLGIPASFALNAVSYGIFIAALVVVRPRRQERASREESRVRDSFRLLRQKPELAAFLVIVAIVGFGSDPVNTLSPAFAHAYGRPDTWAGYLASNTAATTRLQLGVAEQQRGRIMALWTLAFLGLRPFASLLDGAIAKTWSVRAAGVVLATPALAASLAVTASALRQRRDPLRRAAASAVSAASSGSLRSPERR